MTPKQLKTKRNKLGLSQFFVAKHSGVSRYKISIFENGYTELTTKETKRITKILMEASRC